MEANLRVTPEKLKNKSQEFNASDRQVQTLTRQMLDIVGQLSGTWAGDAASAYYTKLKGMSNDMQKLHKMINEHTTDLNEIATTYQQSEQRAVQAASSLKVNNIS